MKKNQAGVKVGDRVIFNGFPQYRCYARVTGILNGNRVSLTGRDDRNKVFIFDDTDKWELDNQAKN